VRMNSAVLYSVFGLFSLVGSLSVYSQSISDVTDEMEALTEKALQAYNDSIREIGDERIPLVTEIGDLENENAALRGSVNRFRKAVSEGKTEIAKLDEALREITAQTDYVTRALEEYLLKFESRIHLAEDQEYKSELLRIRKGIDEESDSAARIIGLQAEAIELGLARAEASLGGIFFDGRAISPEGNVLSGKVAVLGPAAYFTSADGVGNGILRFHSGTIEPEVAVVSEPYGSAISNVINARDGDLPLDASLGNAISLNDANLSFIDHVKQGGYVGYFILFLGVVALLFSLVKLGDMRKSTLSSQDEVQEIALIALEEGVEAAEKRAENIKGPIGDMVRMGVKNLGSSAVLLEEMMLSVILKKRPEMERFLPFLAITAAAAPLLGLLGTVVGMIKTFALITVFGTGDPKALSSGISEALVTTELGLSVAIPTLVLHGLFMRMVKSRIGLMEQSAFDFVKIVTNKRDEK